MRCNGRKYPSLSLRFTFVVTRVDMLDCHLREAAGHRGQSPEGGLRAAPHHRAEPRLAARGPAHDAVEAGGHPRHNRGSASAHPEGRGGAVDSGVRALAQGGLHVEKTDTIVVA